MAAKKGSILGLVELAHAGDLIDIHGASAYDMMRKAFHERMNNWVRAKDKCELLENDRFCVVLRDISNKAELELAAKKLARAFEEPQVHFGRLIPLEITIGFTRHDESRTDMAPAIREAGVALRQARKASRLYEIYTPDSERESGKEQDLVRQLEDAVEKGELELYFQPKMHAGYRTLTGAEALMRWHTQDRKSPSTEEFINVAERNAVIRPMTWWAIKSAVARLARWPKELTISVNIAPTLLQDGEILSVITDATSIHSVDPARLTLEVTESVMADNQQVMVKQLAELWKVGVKISLDDFGTGFCSLAYFRDMPVDEIKIDKGFVMHMLESDKDHAIVKAVIDLAHNFSLKVVAEGVENESIATRLTELGCDTLQGYVFDKPLRVKEFERVYDVAPPQAQAAAGIRPGRRA